MAQSYEQSAELMNDNVFRGRVKVSCLNYADYISGEAPGTAGHTTRYRWSQSVFNNPDMAAQQVTPLVVMDDAVQEAGPEISDAALQSAVEVAVNKMI